MIVLDKIGLVHLPRNGKLTILRHKIASPSAGTAQYTTLTVGSHLISPAVSAFGLAPSTLADMLCLPRPLCLLHYALCHALLLCLMQLGFAEQHGDCHAQQQCLAHTASTSVPCSIVPSRH